jgi:hypothetical protein
LISTPGAEKPSAAYHLAQSRTMRVSGASLKPHFQFDLRELAREPVATATRSLLRAVQGIATRRGQST